MKIIQVVGARPNFMKVAPVIRALNHAPGVSQILVHTGQHYDKNMSEVFFRQLGIKPPDINLEIGSGSHAWQTAQIMMAFEKVVVDESPDLVLVYGDINSTAAAALVCAKLLVPLGHVEAGLRSRDRKMPEEVNRLVTDHLATLLFTPSADGNENLEAEGVDKAKVHLVGNVMIDTLVRSLATAQRPEMEIPDRYALVTLHRPSNVDETVMLRKLIRALVDISEKLPIIFPVHPRTRMRFEEHFSDLIQAPGLKLVDPIGYMEFLYLQQHATVVITDSGGIQEETTYLGVPCLTLRENTERPITASIGTNQVIGRDTARLRKEVDLILAGNGKQGTCPPLWDGHAAERIADIITAGKWLS